MADYLALTLRTDRGGELELVPEFGGLINHLRLGTGSKYARVIAGMADRTAMQQDRIFRGIPLFPFANRLADGRYRYRGQDYQLPINEPARSNALHGFIHHLRPQPHVSETGTGAVAELVYEYDGHLAGYPFPARVEFEYRLQGSESLEVTIAVTNRHVAPIPVGFGWHPYYTLGGAVDDLLLELPKVEEVLVTDRMLPTGEKRSFTDFSKLKQIGDTRFDTCFAIAQHQGNASARLWSEAQGLGLEIWQQAGHQAFKFMQVCIAPDRRSIAIEPVSCGLDAFNTGEGLVHLEPNQTVSARSGVRLLTEIDGHLA